MAIPPWRQKDSTAGYCRWCDFRTPRLSEAAEGRGPSKNTCRKHADHRSRHGHPLKPSYAATEIGPLERIVRRYLKEHLRPPAEADILRAHTQARNLLLRGREPGPLLPRKASERASAILGRFYAKHCSERPEGIRERWGRKASINQAAERLIVIALAIELACKLDPAPVHDALFHETQIGKIVFRRAGGWHRRQERIVGAAVQRIELNRYNTSSGRGVAHLGRQLRNIVAPVWAAHAAPLECAALDAEARIQSWTEAQHTTVRPKRGGYKGRKKRNPFASPHDRVRQVSR